MDLCELTIHELHEMLRKNEISSLDITKSVFKRIDQVEGQIGSFITLMKENAIECAEKSDSRIINGKIGRLTGIPLVIKDNMCMKGIKTTCGSKILKEYIPPYDATVIKMLKEEQPVFVGKTNMDEFAMGSSTETSYFGITKNPWDVSRIPGGSSGGSASAVTADECIAALGSDTGGSIRQPAAFCGAVGLKPTYGRVSRFGLVAFASSLDQIGPITKDVRDCAILMNVIAGYDEMDSTSADMKVQNYEEVMDGNIQGIKAGIPEEYFSEGIDSDVESSVCAAIKKLEKLGVVCKKVSLPHTEYAVAAYYLVAPAEASSNLARYDGVKYGYRAPEAAGLMDMYVNTRSEGFGQEVKRRIMLGTYALSAGYYDAYYKKASQVRTLIKCDFDEVFKECDVIITPTVPTPAFEIGEKREDPLKMYLLDIYTIPANLAGIPGISIPCGFSKKGLPIGLQLLGRHFDEATLLKVAHSFEQNTDYHLKRPVISSCVE
ncbi:MAG: Asp-tRNA(Asn)/Glu-tRNA(Gln) amidotransferase subunit GatA [Thermodesulfobacteriota bacterium]|nr:Asp-tRNA(Asn)/Glu-tRNA(Gln) amidotransferase subunit GatA [Thermodesulfobacteriota bacterium]